jgi:hypothetical protein
MKNYKIIKVEWKDITFFGGHYRVEGIKEYGLKHLETIGFLIEETNEWLKIALTRETTEEDLISDFICIPKVNIIKRSYLK